MKEMGKDKKARGSVSVAEYREGSILARIEELENGNTELLRQIKQRPMEFGEVVVLVAVIDHNLTKIHLLEELKADVEARRGELENKKHDTSDFLTEKNRCSCPSCSDKKLRIEELTWLLGDRGE